MRIQLLFVPAFVAALTLTAGAQTPAPATPESLVAAAKRAAGTDYQGTFVRVCVAPDNLAGGAGGGARGAVPPARVVPDRSTWLRPALQGVRQLLLHRYQDSLRVGACDERGPHRHRHAVRLRDRAGDDRGHDRARPRSAHRQVRARQPRPRRSRPGRGAPAEPLRRQGRDGLRRTGIRRSSVLRRLRAACRSAISSSAPAA
jgi:hypothetical protein